MTPTGRKRAESQIVGEYDKAIRQRWRALALIVKAKLEAVESGIFGEDTFQKEFMGHIVLPDGSTVGDTVLPMINIAYETGKMPKLLPEFSSKKGAGQIGTSTKDNC